MGDDIRKEFAVRLGRKKFTEPTLVFPRAAFTKKLGFFPGASGYLEGRISSVERNIMVLGHDFGTLDYAKKLDPLEDEPGATWRGLRDFLECAGVSLGDCFFTNCYLGYRASGKMIGRFSASSNPDFVRFCESFFEFQISTVKPKLIISMGLKPLNFLAKLSGRNMVFKSWKRVGEVLDRRGLLSLPLNGAEHNVYPIVHPCFRFINARARFESNGDVEASQLRALLRSRLKV